ncbi:unnamed protein product [Withania somnifera]
MDPSSSSQQNQFRYPAPPQQPYYPTRFQPYDPQPYYPICQQPQIYHQQQTQQQYSSYYPPSHSYPPPPQQQYPQTHQQWHHHHNQEAPMRPPGVSIQPSHGQPHFQLQNQQNTYHLPQRTDAALAQLNQLAASVGAPERPSWYPRPQGFGSVTGGSGIYTGPGVGSAAFPAHGPGPGPSGLRSQAGQSLDKSGGRRRGGGRRGDSQRNGGGRRRGDGQSKDGGRRRGKSKDGGRRRGDGRSKGGGRRRGDGQNKDVGRGKFMCEMCKVDCGCMGILRVHLNGKRHKRNLEKLEANENKTIGDSKNVQKPSDDLKPRTAIKPDNWLSEEEIKQNPPQDIPLEEETKQNPPQDIPLEEETKQNPPQDIPLEEKTKQNPPHDIPLEEEAKQNPPHDIPLEEETKQNPPQDIPLEEKTNQNPTHDIPLEEETKQNPPHDIPLEEETKQNPPHDIPLEEETKQNPPPDIRLDTVSSENNLVTEQKIDNEQQADPPKDANEDFLEKKPMMNQSGNQKSGVKRKTLVGGTKNKNISKAKRLAFEPSKSKVVVPLMCDLCNVKCGTQEILKQHLLGSQHMSMVKCFEGHHPIYGQVGLQEIYPPNPVTNSPHHSQGAQQVSNGAQVSDPIASASLLPQNENAAPSATGVVSDFLAKFEPSNKKFCS